MAERSNASDCKSDGLRPTLVQIQLGAPDKMRAISSHFSMSVRFNLTAESYLSMFAPANILN